MLRPCLGSTAHPSGHVLTRSSRCPDCQRLIDAVSTRYKRSKRPYTTSERKRRAAVVRQWRAQYGDYCPGYREQRPHMAIDLTADHIQPVAKGHPESGALTVLCRMCNSTKGAT